MEDAPANGALPPKSLDDLMKIQQSRSTAKGRFEKREVDLLDSSDEEEDEQSYQTKARADNNHNHRPTILPTWYYRGP